MLQQEIVLSKVYSSKIVKIYASPIRKAKVIYSCSFLAIFVIPVKLFVALEQFRNSRPSIWMNFVQYLK